MPKVIRIEDQPCLVPTQDYPHAQWPFEHFNPVQSRLIEVYSGNTNIAIAASTAAGKTCCAEIFMAFEARVQKKKSIYIGPLKALATEKQNDWSDAKHHFHDLNVSICTGDFRLTSQRVKELDDANIIVMTPEMLSSRVRNHKSEKSRFLQDAGCIVFDESHLLTVPGRGDHIEIALMKITEINPDIRIVLLSATMPNMDEVCGWICRLTGRDTHLLESKYRPCPLVIHYETYFDGHKNYDDHEKEKARIAAGIVNYYNKDKFLIFVHTKRTGDLVVQTLKRLGIDAEFHNANLDLTKRTRIETKFKEDPSFRVVVATSTLAWGCYAAGTPVLMADGPSKPIQDVLPGDRVLAMNIQHCFETRAVLKTGPKHVTEALEITLQKGQTVVVSREHRFYGTNNTKVLNYHQARTFAVGDQIAVPTSDLPESDIEFSRIVRIETLRVDADFYDIEVEGLHNYVGGGVISHNCNLPARRVVIVGVDRGLSKVENYDIWQEVGRAGRPAYDPQGDAYIIVPESKKKETIERINRKSPIKSQLLDDFSGHHKVLAFHLISEIHQGSIVTREDFHKWFRRSLAYHQNQFFDDSVIDSVIDLLASHKAVVLENDQYKVTSVGVVASMFYFSPFDATDLKKNFTKLFENHRENNDIALAVALADVDSFRFGQVVNKVERAEISKFQKEVEKIFGIGGVKETAVKFAFAYYNLLNGVDNPVFASIQSGLRNDVDRTLEVLNAVDSLSARWNEKNFFQTLKLRMAYGVKPQYVSLVQIPNIGKARAEKLFKAQIRDVDEFLRADEGKLAKILNLKPEKIQESVKGAKKLKLKNMMG